MGIAENIKLLREQHGLSQAEFGKIAGVSDKAVSTWELGLKEPRMGAIQKIASHFNLKKSNLIEDDGLNLSFSSSNTPDNIPTANNISPMPEMKVWSLLGATACGQPLHRELSQNSVIAPKDIHADFAFQCAGDSMIGARIYDGDIVFVRKQSDVESGQIAVVRIDDEYTLKRVYKWSDYLELRAENPSYKPIILRGFELEQVEIIGLAVHFMGAVI